MIATHTSWGLRIAGGGGAGLFIDALALPGHGLRIGIDIGVLSPDRLVTYLARGVPDDFRERLGAFLRNASIADEGAVQSFEEPAAGLLISVTPVDGMWVEMEVRVVELLDADVTEFDGINFETSRASLLIAADAAEKLGQMWDGRVLEDVEDEEE